MKCAHTEESLYGAGVEGVAELVQRIKNNTYIEVDALLMDRHLRVECAHTEESFYGAGVEGMAELVQHLLQLAQQVQQPRPKHKSRKENERKVKVTVA
jgi:hypothetical protein